MSAAKKNWWKYVLLALVGVEGNYLMVMSQQYTSLTSMQVCVCVYVHNKYVYMCVDVCMRAFQAIGMYMWV